MLAFVRPYLKIWAHLAMKLLYRVVSLSRIRALFIPLYLIFTVAYSYILPLGFDEAYNLQEPRNLISQGFYGSQVRGERVLFDPFISTGPAVLLPIAGSFRLFGDTIIVARIVMFSYHLVMVFLFCYLVKKWYGKNATGLALLVLMTIPGQFFLAVSVLGEVPAMMFFLAGIALLDGSGDDSKRRTLNSIGCGLMWGLCILAKPTLVMLLIGVLQMLLWMWTTGRSDWARIQPWIVALGLAVILGIGQFIIPILYLGPYKYLFSLANASGAATALFNPLVWNNLPRNLITLGGSIELGAIVAALLYLGVSRKKQPLRLSQQIVVGAGTFWMLWWLLFDDKGWTRHVYPALVLLAFPLVYFVLNGLRWLRVKLTPQLLNVQGVVTMGNTATKSSKIILQRNALKGLLIALTLLLFAQLGRVTVSISSYAEMKKQQTALVSFLTEQYKSAELYSSGWTLAWDVAFLGRWNIGDLSQTQLDSDRLALLVVTPDGPDLSTIISTYNLDLLARFGDFAIYRIEKKSGDTGSNIRVE
jgi:4-amino-4-deoxy-L-arabinose transferase-like glycosyltransferase